MFRNYLFRASLPIFSRYFPGVFILFQRFPEIAIFFIFRVSSTFLYFTPYFQISTTLPLSLFCSSPASRFQPLSQSSFSFCLYFLYLGSLSPRTRILLSYACWISFSIPRLISSCCTNDFHKAGDSKISNLTFGKCHLTLNSIEKPRHRYSSSPAGACRISIDTESVLPINI